MNSVFAFYTSQTRVPQKGSAKNKKITEFFNSVIAAVLNTYTVLYLYTAGIVAQAQHRDIVALRRVSGKGVDAFFVQAYY